MRPRFLVFILLMALLALALLFWRRPVQPPSSEERPQAMVQSNTPPAGAHAIGQEVRNVTRPIVPTNLSPASISNYYLAISQKFIESKNKPIDFYGQVIDQDGNPIVGADIKVGLETLTVDLSAEGFVGAKYTHLEYTSGLDGRFEIHGVSGDGGGIQLTKDGYEAESEKNGFGGGTSGSYDNPVIFKMWSTNIREKLITGKYAFKIVPDGRPYYINLTDGTISESGTGDLKVWIEYTNQIKDSQFYNWSAGIDVINGGLQAASDSVMWMAPTNGYMPSFQQSGQIRGYQTGEIGDRSFYIQLQNGNEYGQMTIDLLAPFNASIPGLIRLSYAINPSGSQILR